MLTYKEIHLLVDQGLNSLGIFTEVANLRELVDLGFRRVLNKEINRLIEREDDLTSVDSLLFNELTADVRLTLEKEEGYNYTSSLPSSILSINTATLIVGSSTCTTDEVGSGWYKATSNTVRYKDKNYSLGDKILITEEDLSRVTVGKVAKLKTRKMDLTVLNKSKFNFYQHSSSYKYNFPILTYGKDKVEVYYQARYKNKESDIPIAVEILGFTEFDESRTLSWCKQQLLELPENLQFHLIDKVVAYLAVVNRHPQQNVVNLKTETIN